jgi:hypothetical protein
MFWMQITLGTHQQIPECLFGWVWVMVFNTAFNNISVISWQSVLLMEEIGVSGENH